MEGTSQAVSVPVPEQDLLPHVLREGAQKMLAQAIESEVAEWIDAHSQVRDEQARRQVVRNGYLPERKIIAGLGEIEVRQPRVHDRRPEGEREPFSSKILPPYLRKTKERRGADPLAVPHHKKELLVVMDGYRESEQSWRELLHDLVQRGLAVAPKLAVGDGSLGFWAALAKVWPRTAEQRCWMYKAGNVLDKLPKNKQAAANAKLNQIWMAETRNEATAAFDAFLEDYRAKIPRRPNASRRTARSYSPSTTSPPSTGPI